MMMVSPGLTCRVAVPASVPGGSTNDVSTNCATTYCLPLTWNDGGASNPDSSAFTVMLYAELVPLAVVTVICCDPVGVLDGTCAFTCPGLMKSMKADWPPIVTFTLSSEVGALVPMKSEPAHPRVVDDRLAPKISIQEPGATEVKPPKAPALTTPLAEMAGVLLAAAGVSV